MAINLVFLWQSQRDSNPCRHLERALRFVPSVRWEFPHVPFRQAEKVAMAIKRAVVRRFGT